MKNIGCKGPIPHVGFNSISLKKKNTQINKILDSDYYFTHSYGLNYNEKNLNFDQFGITNYNKSTFITFFIYKNIIATQFHPEKSGLAGLKLLSYFLMLKKRIIFKLYFKDNYFLFKQKF